MNQPLQEILISTQSMAPSFGGPAVSVAQIARGVAAHGASVDIVTGDGSRLEDLSCGRLDEGSSYNLVRSFGIWSMLNHRVSLWARRSAVPLIISPLGMLEPWALRQKRLKKWVAWRAYQRSDLAAAAAVHVTSADEADAVRSVGITRPIAVIPHGVELPGASAISSRLPSPFGIRTALFLSRIHPKKGLPLLVEAWARVKPANWRLIIAGPDSDGHRDKIAALVGQLGISDTVSIREAAFGDEKEALWRETDLFVLPTYSENFGIVVAEAQARAIPVITTTGTPWRDLVEVGSGWQVAPETDALAAALHDATSSPAEVRIQMGARGRRLMQERYSWAAAIAQHRALNNWCIAGGPAPDFLRL